MKLYYNGSDPQNDLWDIVGLTTQELRYLRDTLKGWYAKEGRSTSNDKLVEFSDDLLTRIREIGI